ncbi:hypothetical protein GWI33_021997 [Rhynchophorus ferrugineus]|uniref:Uncharacterized protein n=1 Tax=Rhynchophorus ferrugineus TaxID=354439 RepID=A0A834J0T1_RHYFE|nr:hypothetical protein GWI33_021997 [Rhynchophorus ferrugineus]
MKLFSNIPETTKNYGVDGLTISELSLQMKFSIELVPLDDETDYGKVLSNNSVVGSLGQVVKRLVDLQGNARFLTDYGTDDFEFTITYGTDKICIIVPKSDKYPKWLVLFMIFPSSLWLAILTVIIISVILYKYLYGSSFVISVLDTYTILLNQSPVDKHKKAKILAARIFIGSLLLFSMIISTIFLGSLFTSFGVTKYRPDINTLEEFDKSGNQIESSFNPFPPNSSHLFDRLTKKIIAKSEDDLPSIELTSRYKIPGLERFNDAELLLRTKYTDANGQPKLHIVHQCPQVFFLTYIVPKGSPYLVAINRNLMAFQEAGLNSKWYNDYAGALVLHAKMQRDQDINNNQYKNLELDDIHFVFYFLCIGYAISFVVFICELSRARYHQFHAV